MLTFLILIAILILSLYFFKDQIKAFLFSNDNQKAVTYSQEESDFLDHIMGDIEDEVKQENFKVEPSFPANLQHIGYLHNTSTYDKHLGSNMAFDNLIFYFDNQDGVFVAFDLQNNVVDTTKNIPDDGDYIVIQDVQYTYVADRSYDEE